MKIHNKMLAASMAALLAACGGGGSSDNTGIGHPDDTVHPIVGSAGVFDVNYGQFRGVYTLLDNGDFYGVHFVGGSTLAGHPRGKLSAANSVNALEPIAWANFIDDLNQTGAQEPAGMFGRTFGATGLSVRISGSMGTFSSTATAQKTYAAGDAKTLYGDPLPMSLVAGKYSGSVRTVGIQTPLTPVSDFLIDVDGNVSVTAVGCAFTGKLVRHGATGIFDAQIALGGAACKLGSSLKGIVTPLSVRNSVPELALQLNSDDKEKTAVFILSKN